MRNYQRLVRATLRWAAGDEGRPQLAVAMFGLVGIIFLAAAFIPLVLWTIGLATVRLYRGGPDLSLHAKVERDPYMSRAQVIFDEQEGRPTTID